MNPADSKKTTTRRYPCGVCGKERKAEQMIYSSHTRTHYCATLCKRPRGSRR